MSNNDDRGPENTRLNNIECDEYLNCPISLEEINLAINKLKTGKSPGYDNVLNEYIITASNKINNLLLKLFNIILTTGIYPDPWKLGEIIPIYKNKGDNKDPSNYRPITLTSCISKLFSIILNERLSKYIENIINPNQGAFLKGSSTTNHLFALHSLIEYSKCIKKTLYCAFIDLSKAYDLINRSYMFSKLASSGVHGKFMNVVKSMYSNTKAYIKYNGLKSTQCITNIGIKQGCNVSCLIFAIYLNDLEVTMRERSCKGITVNDMDENNVMLQLFSLLYADDTIIMAMSAKDLQYALQIYSEYCQKWKLKINAEKTKILTFGKNINKTQFTINGNSVESINNFKYLGLIFNKNGKYINAIKHNIDKARKASFAILKRSKELNLTVSCQLLVHILESIIKPILLYGCEIFCYENLTIIDNFYAQLLRRILLVNKSTPHYSIFGEFGCTPPSVDVKKRALVFWIKTSHSNSLANTCQDILLECNNKNEYCSPYIKYIKDSFSNLGLGDLFNKSTTLCAGRNPVSTIKRRIRDIFIQTWLQKINNSPKFIFYRLIKTEFKFENYLDQLPFNKRIVLTQFRLSNHKLPIETGRWFNISREQRICPLCINDTLGDEFHYLFECDEFSEERRCYLKKYYLRNPNVIKINELFNTGNKTILSKLYMFIKIINNKLMTTRI